MMITQSQAYTRVTILVSCVVLSVSGCQSADSGGNFAGFTNPLSGVPSQSEPAISTLEPEPEKPSVASGTDEETE